MTFATYTAENLPETTIIGPYSEWPRRTAKARRTRLAASIGGVAGAAVFIHCALPLLAT